jgi:hypothetical protein
MLLAAPGCSLLLLAARSWLLLAALGALGAQAVVAGFCLDVCFPQPVILRYFGVLADPLSPQRDSRLTHLAPQEIAKKGQSFWQLGGSTGGPILGASWVSFVAVLEARVDSFSFQKCFQIAPLSWQVVAKTLEPFLQLSGSTRDPIRELTGSTWKPF